MSVPVTFEKLDRTPQTGPFNIYLLICCTLVSAEIEFMYFPVAAMFWI